MRTALAGSSVTLDLSVLRPAGALLLAGGAVQPLLPGPGGLPCPLRTMTGIPCPLCGMTTSVTAAVHLDIVGALAANPVGVLAVMVALALLVARPKLRQFDVPRWAPVALLLGMWLFQLQRFQVL